MRRAYQINPELREVRRRDAAAAANRPEERVRRSAAAKAQGFAAIGRSHRTPESFERGRRRHSEARLRGIPGELHDLYRELRRKKLTAAEARAVVLAHHERDMARFRARFCQ
jgi:hypothetical protein